MDKDDYKKLQRDIDDIKKYLELVYKEREIIESLQGSVKHLQTIILANQEHQDITKKDLKSDIKDVANIVEAKVDEVHQTMDNKTIVIAKDQNILSKIMKKIGR